jgi:hypothetical protein
MPYLSDAQRKFMHAVHPKIAKRWDKHTPDIKHLPEHVKPERGKNDKHDKSAAVLAKFGGSLVTLQEPFRTRVLAALITPNLQPNIFHKQAGAMLSVLPIERQAKIASNLLMRYTSPDSFLKVASEISFWQNRVKALPLLNLQEKQAFWSNLLYYVNQRSK